MEELERLQRAFLAADQRAQNGDKTAQQDARIFAQEIRRIQAQGLSEPAKTPQGEGVMGRLNEGIARGLGGPVDIMAAGLSAVGLGSGDAFGGSESIRRGMQNIGIALPEEPPSTLGGQFVQGVGEAAGFILPTGAIARGMQTLGPMAANIGRRIMDPFVRGPLAATTAELAAGGSARVGGELASQATEGQYGDIARPFGEVVGGLLGALAPGAALSGASRVIQATPVAGTAIRAAKAAIVPFTEAGGRVRASDRLRSLSADPEGQAGLLQQESIGGLSPAVQTGDPNLIALERSILERNPALRDQFSASRRASNVALRETARASGGEYGISDTRSFIEGRRASFVQGIQNRIEAARQESLRTIQALDPQRAPGGNSAIVRQELERAYKDANEIERELWGSIPRSVTVPTSQSRRVFADIEARTPRAQKSDIYADARQFLAADGEFKDIETVNEMHGLYNRLRRDAREAIAGLVPNQNRARISNTLADAIWEDLTFSPSTMDTALANQLNEAREFTRTMNEAFGQGVVGDVLSQTRAGGERISPEMTLGATVGRGGTAGSVASQQIGGAINFPQPRPAATATTGDAVQDFLRENIRRVAAPGGRDFSPQAAARFAEQNREVLQQYPQLRAQLDQAIAAGMGAARAEQRLGGIASATADPRRSVGAAIETARPGSEIERSIFGAKNPVAAAREVARQAARDTSGVASSGLKGGFVDYLMQQSKSGPADAAGNPTISGNNLVGFLKDNKNRAVAASILGPEDLKRLDAISEEFQKLEIARGAGTLTAPMEDMPNRIIGLVAGTLAARAGAKLGAGTSGASLRTANLATQTVNKVLGNLTNDKAEALLRDAIQDKELFRALLMPVSTKAHAKYAEDRLAEWLVGYAATQVTGE